MHTVKYCQQCFSFDVPSDRGKSEPERLKVNSVNFVSVYTLVKFLFVYLSVYLFGCLSIRFF